MPQVPKAILKEYFESGDKPTQGQFYTLIDSTFNLVDDQAALGFRVYSTTRNYVTGDITVYSGLIYQAIAATSGTFDPDAWLQLNPGGASIVSNTYTELAALKAAGNMIPGRIYFISNRNVWLRAITADRLSIDGYYLATNADYQNISGENVGIWNPSLTGLTIGVLTIWGNLHWRSLTGVAGTEPPSDATNWIVSLPSTDSSYVNELDNVKFDFDADFMFERSDKRSNVVTTSNDPGAGFGNQPIDLFQWGRDGVFGNIVRNSILDISNARVANFGILAVNLCRITVTEDADCSRGTFSGIVMFPKLTSNLLASTIRDIRIPSSLELMEGPGKRAEDGFSDFETEVDITGLTDLNIGPFNYNGIYHLTSSNSTEVLETCNLAVPFPMELRPAAGLTLDINHGTGLGKFGLNAPTITLNGDMGDFARFRRNQVTGVWKLVSMQNYI